MPCGVKKWPFFGRLIMGPVFLVAIAITLYIMISRVNPGTSSTDQCARCSNYLYYRYTPGDSDAFCCTQTTGGDCMTLTACKQLSTDSAITLYFLGFGGGSVSFSFTLLFFKTMKNCDSHDHNMTPQQLAEEREEEEKKRQRKERKRKEKQERQIEKLRQKAEREKPNVSDGYHRLEIRIQRFVVAGVVVLRRVAQECPICEETMVGRVNIRLECGHGFHAECICLLLILLPQVRSCPECQ